jgi:hypothetical protein
MRDFMDTLRASRILVASLFSAKEIGDILQII